MTNNKNIKQNHPLDDHKKSQREKRRDFDVEELKRKSRGTTLANQRVATVEGLTKALVTDIKRVEKTVNTHYDDLDNRLSEAHRAIDDLKRSEPHRYDLEKTKLEVNHRGSIEVVTPWGWSFLLGVAAMLIALIGFTRHWWVNKDLAGDERWVCSILIGIAVFFAVASFERFKLHLDIGGKLLWRRRDQEQEFKTAIIESVVVDEPAKTSAEKKEEATVS